MKTGVLGGTFDPPHVGHLHLAVQARHQLGLDRVLLVVANDPWQKRGTRRISAAEDRYDMAAAAVSGSVGLEASRLEIDRGGASYSVDTVSELRAAGDDVFLVIGSDLVDQLATWHRWEELAGMCTLAVGNRGGHSATVVSPPWRAVALRLASLEISSTELRAMVSEGQPVDFLVPEPAVRVMMARRLYQRRTSVQ